MKTIILCGGLGYRLKEEMELQPKPMVLIGGKPLLWHIMKIYAHWGYNEFIIALGYKGDCIKDYFLNQEYFFHDFTLHTNTGITKIHREKTDGKLIDDFKITFVDTGAETLPGERTLCCRDYIPPADSDFMMAYEDGVGDVNLKEVVAFHKKRNIIGTITGVYPRSKYGLLRLDREDTALRFVKKPVLEDRVNGRFMVFKKIFLNTCGLVNWNIRHLNA
jgi:glucose-1-phosphate cytidylyltransferase